MHIIYINIPPDLLSSGLEQRIWNYRGRQLNIVTAGEVVFHILNSHHAELLGRLGEL